MVSQSGRSPDIIALSKAAREGGALVIGILNAPDAPLAEVCHHVLLAGAYPEVSVAATKSMTMSWLAGLLLIDALKGGTAREAALAHLPASMEAATAAAWGDRRDVAGEGPLLVLARGAGLAVAREGALKIRELAGLPCEAFSAAEFMHGPAPRSSPTRASSRSTCRAGPATGTTLLGMDCPSPLCPSGSRRARGRPPSPCPPTDEAPRCACTPPCPN